MESICKHCKQTFEISTKSKGWMANHSRWCTFNPKRKEYDDFLKQRREIFVTSKEILDKRSQAVKDAWKRGSYDGIDHGKGFRGKEHSEESKSKISKGALNSNHRRLRKNPIEYKGVVPARSVVIPGSYTKKFPAGDYQVPCAIIIGQRKPSTDLKTSLNDALREYNVAV